ncbi:uncharacterized protein KGF55_005134 [Candida pseudojiufengensis]|uniref:uncharacterized protein n=1 Tax=Candida pseudojiufengensis TaxID=497109 RepID=UPI00222400CD|nr:uncharacterized protein KGF55_005134 [Candida pseudojiufengensis]KAI5959902.1 hypothetical protein KGF55_005134 [Candida pseudojiufengensis]
MSDQVKINPDLSILLVGAVINKSLSEYKGDYPDKKASIPVNLFLKDLNDKTDEYTSKFPNNDIHFPQIDIKLLSFIINRTLYFKFVQVTQDSVVIEIGDKYETYLKNIVATSTFRYSKFLWNSAKSLLVEKDQTEDVVTKEIELKSSENEESTNTNDADQEKEKSIEQVTEPIVEEAEEIEVLEGEKNEETNAKETENVGETITNGPEEAQEADKVQEEQEAEEAEGVEEAEQAEEAEEVKEAQEVEAVEEEVKENIEEEEKGESEKVDETKEEEVEPIDKEVVTKEIDKDVEMKEADEAVEEKEADIEAENEQVDEELESPEVEEITTKTAEILEDDELKEIDSESVNDVEPKSSTKDTEEGETIEPEADETESEDLEQIKEVAKTKEQEDSIKTTTDYEQEEKQEPLEVKEPITETPKLNEKEDVPESLKETHTPEPTKESRKRQRSRSPAPAQHHKRFQNIAVNLLNSIMEHRFSSPFLQAVNAKDAPNYYDIIYQPKDLKSIAKALKSKVDPPKYSSIKELERDIMLMFANCIMYNKPDEDLVELTRTMKKDVGEIFKMFKEAEKDIH